MKSVIFSNDRVAPIIRIENLFYCSNMHRNNQIELTCWRAKIPLPFLDSVICINYRLSQQHQPQKTNIQRKREKIDFRGNINHSSSTTNTR